MNWSLTFCLLFLTALFLSAKDLAFIENPTNPPSKNAGRVIALKELARISDSGDKFYFKRPGVIRIAADESFYIIDDNQILHFAKNATFLANLQKKGEGPGEFSFANAVFPQKDKLYIYSQKPSKILEFSSGDTFLREYKADHSQGVKRIIAQRGNTFWFARAAMDQVMNANTGVRTLHLEVFRETENKPLCKMPITFDEQWRLVKIQNKDTIQVVMNAYIPAGFVADDACQNLYCFNTREYAIARLDLDKEKITARFRRPYKPIKYYPNPNADPNVKNDTPDPEFFPDIYRILWVDGNLWVITSTVEKNKGVEVDVFTPEGKYSDSFRLPLPGVSSQHHLDRLTLAVRHNTLITVERDSEENPVIVKYQMNP